MKSYLSIVLVMASIFLAVALFLTKHGDNAQMEADAAAITDFSNRLDTAQTKITTHEGTILTLSNDLAQCNSAALAFSNHLAEARSTIALDAEQITNLNQRLDEKSAQNQALDQQVAGLTGQLAGLTNKLALTETSLAQTNQALVQSQTDYAQLENRLRRVVAGRLIMERKFYNVEELRAQIYRLQQDPAPEVSADRIYAGINVEVRSNGTFHVLTEN